MTTYESPTIVELGSVQDLTRGTGDDRYWDSNWGQLAGFGFLLSTGNRPDVS